MFAATERVLALPMYMCSQDDFSGIDGLDVVAVLVPQR